MTPREEQIAKACSTVPCVGCLHPSSPLGSHDCAEYRRTRGKTTSEQLDDFFHATRADQGHDSASPFPAPRIPVLNHPADLANAFPASSASISSGSSGPNGASWTVGPSSAGQTANTGWTTLEDEKTDMPPKPRTSLWDWLS